MAFFADIIQFWYKSNSFGFIFRFHQTLAQDIVFFYSYPTTANTLRISQSMYVCMFIVSTHGRSATVGTCVYLFCAVGTKKTTLRFLTHLGIVYVASVGFLLPWLQSLF